MKKILTLLFISFFAWHFSAVAQTSIYTYTGAVQTYTVPPGVISVTVDTRGGDGGASYYYVPSTSTYYPTYRNRGGYGARVVCSLTVTPGQVLNVYVGGNGDSSNIYDYYYYYTGTLYDSGLGGWNGGGNGGSDTDYYYYYGYGGGGGGGASDIRIGGTALTNRVIVAGGGGGGAWDCTGVSYERGGDGGGLTGEAGYWCNANTNGLFCGGGGTPSAGGPGATDYSCGYNSGTLGIGGSADTCYTYYYYYDDGGGGGGGGYYGGGAGEWGGGGGGSSYTDATRTTAVVHTRGYNSTLADSIIITVNCSAGAINGVTSICTGFTTTLSDTVSGSHSWSSSNTAIATVGATGIVTGLSAGTATITYSVMAFCGSVYSIAVVTVNPLPAAITGLTGVCLGVSTALFDAATGGSWSSGSTGIASVVSSTGMTYGAGLGTSAITYTLPTGCIATTAVTVTALSTPITGTGVMCGGATTVLSDATSGGTWSSSSVSIASVNLASGLVTGGNVSAVGTATITYTAGGGCTVLKVVTVDPQPAAITGASSLCSGVTVSLFDGGGGNWSSSNTGIATIGLSSGIVTGMGSGTATITYTLGAGCNTTDLITVLPSPSAIAGVTSLCTAATDTLLNATSGGIWTSSNTTVAAIDPFAGIVIAGYATGVATISYTLSAGGCAASTVVTVNVGPLPISGTLAMCIGTTTGLSDGIGSGSWSSGNAGIATIDASGNVYSVAAGTATISYSLGSCSVTAIVTVNPLPSPVAGVSELCVGLATLLSDASTGGSWSSSNARVASVVSASGILTGGAAGTATISYTLPSGCAATTIVTINTGPPVITGVTHVCPGATTALADAGGGSWSSGNTAVATVGSTGVVSGVASGTASIAYSIGAGCATSTMVTVNPLPASIGGVTAMCAGSTMALSDGTGTWSSGTTAVATIISASGVVTGATPGTTTITYTASATGCTTHTTVTVNTLPSAITGTFSACPGATTSLSDATTGGVWSSGNTAIATISTTGTLTGAAPGTVVIAYTSATGCAIHTTITINPLPLAVTGTLSICAGATAALVDATTGGLWISGSTGSIATVTTTSGMVRGVSAGTAIISYVLSTGCARTNTVTVNPLPTAIIGPSAECVGATIAEAESLTGGTWGSSVATVATVVPIGAGCNVTGAATGTTVITYISATGCIATTTITVSLSPTGIIGSPSVCADDTTTLSDAIAGGAWSSSNAAAATVGSLSGTVTGVATGTTTITYSLGTGCTVTEIMSVNTSPSVITGGTSLCIGATAMVADATTGGAWSSGSTSSGIAAVSGTGMVTGISAGTGTITYTHGGCSANAIVTVNPTPTAIFGTGSVCAGASTALSDGVGGGEWTSSNTTIASVSAGVVTGMSPGTATVTYSLGADCAVTKTVTVNPISAITGSLGICLGTTTTLSDAIAGGAWSSGVTTMATISTMGVVRGTLAGTSMITYTTTAGCLATAVLTVNLAPSAISGTLSVCAGVTTVLGNTAGGGVWTSGNTMVATVGSTGIVTGIIPGTATITYSLGSGCTVTSVVTVNAGAAAITGTANICGGTTTLLADVTTGGAWSSIPATIATVTAGGVVTGVTSGIASVTYTPATGCAAIIAITVNSAPAPITGAFNICAGVTTALSSSTTGGTWTSSNTAVATVGSTGIVTGIIPGTSSIGYSFGSGCAVASVVTVNAGAAMITGATNICAGSTAAFDDATAGGVWGSIPATIASVTSAGMVTGITAGIANITYTPATGCAAVTTITINPSPSPITGTPNVCAGLTTTLIDATTGGSWGSSSTSIATADPVLGIITGIAPGTAVITYTLPAGCSANTTAIINSAPPAITGSMGICILSTTTLADPLGGGTWGSSNSGIASVSLAGIVSGIALGTSTINYTVGGCPATSVVTVNSLPDAISGTSLCVGSTETLADLPDGGTWSSSNAGIATIDETEGVVTGMSAGTATIAYSLGAGCTVTAAVIVEALPGAIMGTPEVCLGYLTTLIDVAGGGVWSSSNTAIATVSGAGAVSGVAGGPVTISYTRSSTGCAATRLLTVVAVPAITGVSDMCAFSTVIDVSDSLAGGTWTSTSVTVSTTGVVSPYSAGAASITYTIPLGCYTTTSFTVHPLPGPVTGDFHFCVGLSAALGDTTGGGAWHSSNTAIASVNTAGLVRGLTGGTAIISYVMPTGCMETETIVVDSLPVAGTITGLPVVCVGAAIGLSDLAAGGVWSSSNTSAAVSGGIVSGVSAGVDTIKYTVSNSCSSATATKTIVVNPLPEAGTVSGPEAVCISDSIVLYDAVPGGIWSSSAAAITRGIVHGIATGTDTIRYSVTNSCGTAVAVKTVTINTLPDAGSVSLLDTICTGFTFLLTDSIPGGAWSSSNSSISISSSGLISALTAGVDTISYSLTNMCGTISASATIAVKAVPAPDTITGSAYVCEGGADTLTVTPLGGVWGSSNANVTVTPTITGAIISGILPGTDTLTYTMPGECSPVGAIYPVTVLSLNQCDSNTGTHALSKGEEVLQVWPNPNDGMFTVLLSANTDESVRITITNIIGEQVKALTTVTNKATAIKLNEATGVYFINASTTSGNYEAKVVFTK